MAKPLVYKTSVIKGSDVSSSWNNFMLAKRKALRRTESFELFLSFEKGSLTAGTVFDDVP
jgi:hypothetical protein